MLPVNEQRTEHSISVRGRAYHSRRHHFGFAGRERSLVNLAADITVSVRAQGEWHASLLGDSKRTPPRPEGSATVDCFAMPWYHEIVCCGPSHARRRWTAMNDGLSGRFRYAINRLIIGPPFCRPLASEQLYRASERVLSTRSTPIIKLKPQHARRAAGRAKVSRARSSWISRRCHFVAEANHNIEVRAFFPSARAACSWVLLLDRFRDCFQSLSDRLHIESPTNAACRSLRSPPSARCDRGTAPWS